MEFLSTAAEHLQAFWPHLVAAASLAAMLIASAHLVMYKKDTRAAIGWIAVIIMVPLLGAVLYSLLGINRVRRRAVTLRGGPRRLPAASKRNAAKSTEIDAVLSREAEHLAGLDKLIGALTHRPLLHGNRIKQLIGGQEAYPQMLAAIREAKTSITLCSYIFDNDAAGAEFADALAVAVERGIEVRVLIDDIGVRYTFPSILRRLRHGGVKVATFMPTLVRRWFAYSNLRSHRKILVTDGRIGFTGGMNIRAGHDASLNPKHPIRDHHFRIEGPVVAHLQEVFADDWAFTTGELLEGKNWFPKLDPVGPALARGIGTGPDEDSDKLRLTLEGAVASARKSVTVMTPYFLPEAPLIAALNIAALRGVEVDIILPAANNLNLVKWASTALLWQVLKRGCRVWMSPPPFDHTKLMLVDRVRILFGSANWDPRSLRLNFEFDVECYDRQLAEDLDRWMCIQRKQSHQVTLEEVDGRRLPVRLRDGVARLLTPYL